MPLPQWKYQLTSNHTYRSLAHSLRLGAADRRAVVLCVCECVFMWPKTGALILHGVVHTQHQNVCLCVCVGGGGWVGGWVGVVECAARWLVSGCTTRGRKHAGMWGGNNGRGRAQGAGRARAGAASQRQRAGSETDLFSKVELDHKGYTTLSLHTNLKHELDHKGHTTLTSHHSDSTPCAHSSLHPAAPCSLHPRGK